MSAPGQTAITGIGQTAYTKDSGRTVMALCAEASMKAIEDAGLERGDIDGLISFTMDTNSDHDLQSALGLPLVRWTAKAPFGGEGAYATFQLAAAAIESGQAGNVLIFRAFNERSEARFGQPSFNPSAMPRDFHRSLGLVTPGQVYAMWHKPFLDARGMTNEDLGHLVVQMRAWAANNPDAWFYGRPITLEDHQRSRWIVKPVLRLYDFCQETDGGVAFVDPRHPGLGVRAFLTSAGVASLTAAGGVAGTLDEYDALRISLGVPDGSRDLEVEKALLLENGFEALHGVDFDKGCYVGQEITARTKYRGLAKKKLVTVGFAGAAPPPDTIIMQDGHEAGVMRSHAGDRGLALLRLDALEKAAPLLAGETVIKVGG